MLLAEGIANAAGFWMARSDRPEELSGEPGGSVLDDILTLESVASSQGRDSP